jgi:hypothetical protein
MVAEQAAHKSAQVPAAVSPAAIGTAELQQQQSPKQQTAVGSAPAPAAAADCLGCRLTGLALGVGGGGYVASRLFEQPYPKRAHKYALVGVSAGLFALGVGRALGF